MPIDFPCPLCGEKLSVNQSLAGKKGLCPSCREHVNVPDRSSPPRKSFRPPPPKSPARQPTFVPPSFPDMGAPGPFEYFMQQIPSAIVIGEGVSHTNLASNYLQVVVNEAADRGWEFFRVDEIGVRENPGCLSALLGVRSITVSYYVVTFRRPRD